MTSATTSPKSNLSILQVLRKNFAYIAKVQRGPIPQVMRQFLHVTVVSANQCLIPGDMGTGSYVLVGQEKAMQETFGSACHGAGRVMSRTQAVKNSRGRSISRELADQGVLVMAGSKGTLSEEMPEAYKNLNDVVQVVHDAGIARKVARLKVNCLYQR